MSRSRELTLGLLPLLIGLQFFYAGYAIRQAWHGYTDFRQLYCGAYMVRAGMRHEMYDLSLQKSIENRIISLSPAVLPANHPTVEYLLLAPLSLFHFRLAYLLWTTLNLAAVAASIILLPVKGGWLKAFLFAGFAPISFAVIHGQDSMWLLPGYF